MYLIIYLYIINFFFFKKKKKTNYKSPITPFFKEGNRAKIFELMDNEIPNFRVTIPDENFKELIENAQVDGLQNITDFGNNIDFGNNTNSSEGAQWGDENAYGESYKIKNASLIVEINGEKKSFNKVTFTLGGSSSRMYGRQAFNLKIRGNKDLYGRSQFRIRPDAREATYLRSKLSCDIHNRLGLISISANYISLYVNDEYLGLYVIMDAPKLSWAELQYGDKDTTTIYKCKTGGNILTVYTCAKNCLNENEDVTDNTEWVELLTALDNAQSAEDIEDIFDIDQFLYEIAFEYLAGSWDHFLSSGHNFSMYKPKNGKWTIIYYDFDADIGQDVSGIEFGLGKNAKADKDFPGYSFADWANKPRHILDILIYKDPTRFENILKNFVTEVFNPAVLFPHIDELKEFIKPHIIRDKTPDENGKCPGMLNQYGYDYSYEQWDANSEFTSVNLNGVGSAYGIKYWILRRYRNVCKTYQMECDPIYMDENYEYTIDKNVEGEIISGQWGDFELIDLNIGVGKQNTTIPQPTETQPTETQPTETQPIETQPIETQPIETQPTETQSTETQPTEIPENLPYQCTSELVGYPCCAKGIKTIYDHDATGDWGYDFKKGEWCGLTPYIEQTNDEVCWSEVLGYPCCKNCFVYDTDEDGQWGYENNQWCGIQSFCSA